MSSDKFSLDDLLAGARSEDPPGESRRMGAETESAALVACRNGHGVLLAHEGPGIECEVEAIGRWLEDLGLDDAPDGLSIWEGYLYTSKDYYGEVDGYLIGKFRELTEIEWNLFRQTGAPWELNS